MMNKELYENIKVLDVYLASGKEFKNKKDVDFPYPSKIKVAEIKTIQFYLKNEDNPDVTVAPAYLTSIFPVLCSKKINFNFEEQKGIRNILYKIESSDEDSFKTNHIKNYDFEGMSKESFLDYIISLCENDSSDLKNIDLVNGDIALNVEKYFLKKDEEDELLRCLEKVENSNKEFKEGLQDFFVNILHTRSVLKNSSGNSFEDIKEKYPVIYNPCEFIEFLLSSCTILGESTNHLKNFLTKWKFGPMARKVLLEFERKGEFKYFLNFTRDIPRMEDSDFEMFLRNELAEACNVLKKKEENLKKIFSSEFLNAFFS